MFTTDNSFCVTLKCLTGPHIGQKFRLEPTEVRLEPSGQIGGGVNGEFSFPQDKEDVFKMGRSTGKQFKEKGVSLYKDKEISTTHATVCNTISDRSAIIPGRIAQHYHVHVFFTFRLRCEMVRFSW